MMKGVPNYLVALAIIALACSVASAYDPAPLQDFCVAVNTSTDAVFVNGKFCKDPKLVTPNDFFFQGLNTPRNTANPLGSNVTLLDVSKILGLNTLGVSLARIDFAPYGLNPPHIHPRATEILVVVEGKTNAVAFSGLGSQNPGLIVIAKNIFGANPPINPDVLVKAFQLDTNVVESLQKKFM
ncbi:hypothetical protein SLA2020_272040 [Shorea laevis]